MTRINKVIDLLDQGQPVYITHTPGLDYENGKEMSKTFADMIIIDFEHHAFDILGLRSFMKGLVDGGPTLSGHQTPTVITTLPSNCTTVNEVLANAWQARHVLSTGVHGILNTHTRTPEAVKAFVAVCRYPFQTLGLEKGIPEGLRGAGGQREPADIWNLSPSEYVKKADPWPLNPDGELLLGLKIEDRHCLEKADQIAGVPGISFAEWGPGDMGMSFGLPDAHDPPYPKEMDEARNIVKSACEKSGVFFYSSWIDPEMNDQQRIKYIIEELNVKITGANSKEIADYGRRLTNRTMPY